MSDLIVRIDLTKLQEIWSPFRFVIWDNIDTPITNEEISEAIRNREFIPPALSKEQNICVAPTRKEHICRIAWFVENYNIKSNPIDVDFGITDLFEKIAIMDGNHRMAAALYRKEKYIWVNCEGSFDRIYSMEYKIPVHKKILRAISNFILWLFYFVITTQERLEYGVSKDKRYKCVGSEDSSIFLPGSERTFYFDRDLPPSRNYMTWKEFWDSRD